VTIDGCTTNTSRLNLVGLEIDTGAGLRCAAGQKCCDLGPDGSCRGVCDPIASQCGVTCAAGTNCCTTFSDGSCRSTRLCVRGDPQLMCGGVDCRPPRYCCSPL